MSGYTSNPTSSENGVPTDAFDKAPKPWWWLTMGEEDNASLSIPIVSVALAGMFIGLIFNILLVLLIVKLCANSSKKANLTFKPRSKKYRMDKDHKKPQGAYGGDSIPEGVIIQKVSQRSDLEIIDENNGCNAFGTNPSTNKSLKISML